ncbi:MULTISPECIES: hypothetical protein [Salinibaculum]|uniref:hypothetical protein n=1 Tax=Salinibaculum TaxID=2732368 RepID=UPI0030CE6E98
MVGGVSEEERSSFARRAKIGFVLLVGLSGGLITLQADAGAFWFLVATGIGMAVGVVLVWITFPDRQELRQSPGSNDSRRRGRR